jgi:hypothetical protein
MGLFDKLFGGKKSEQPTDTNQGGEVNAPLNPDTAAESTPAPVTDNTVSISSEGQFTPPAVTAPETPAAEDTPAEPAVAETPAAPAEPAEEAVQPGDSTLETAPESETTEDKTV